LYPGLGFVGILATMLLATATANGDWPLLAVLVAISIAVNLVYVDGGPITGWTAVDTRFDSVRATTDPSTEFVAAQRIQSTAVGVAGRVVIFPEGIVYRWTEATDMFWKPTFEELQAQGKTILVGAGLPVAGSAAEIRNAVVIKGADSAAPVSQRIPVPIATWRCWGKRRVRLNLAGPPTTDIAGERAAILLGYEQLLPWSYLTAFLRKPTVIVGVSNAYWIKHTVIPKQQRAGLRAWGRLFCKAVVSAANF
jgi:hypothetical protein